MIILFLHNSFEDRHNIYGPLPGRKGNFCCTPASVNFFFLICHGSALLDQLFTDAMQALHVLLLKGFNGNKPHVRAGNRLTDPFCIVGIILLVLDIGHHKWLIEGQYIHFPVPHHTHFLTSPYLPTKLPTNATPSQTKQGPQEWRRTRSD